MMYFRVIHWAKIRNRYWPTFLPTAFSNKGFAFTLKRFTFYNFVKTSLQHLQIECNFLLKKKAVSNAKWCVFDFLKKYFYKINFEVLLFPNSLKYYQDIWNVTAYFTDSWGVHIFTGTNIDTVSHQFFIVRRKFIEYWILQVVVLVVRKKCKCFLISLLIINT